MTNSKVVGTEGDHRTNFDERRLAHHAAGLSARYRPRGVGAVSMRGLDDGQIEPLGEEEERVEEIPRQRDVVIDHDQPVVSLSRMAGQEAIDVFELAAIADRRREELDLMSRADQLGRCHIQQVGHPLPLDAERQDTSAWATSRGPGQPPPASRGQGSRVRRRVGRHGPARRSYAVDLPAGPGEEVLGRRGRTRSRPARACELAGDLLDGAYRAGSHHDAIQAPPPNDMPAAPRQTLKLVEHRARGPQAHGQPAGRPALRVRGSD